MIARGVRRLSFQGGMGGSRVVEAGKPRVGMGGPCGRDGGLSVWQLLVCCPRRTMLVLESLDPNAPPSAIQKIGRKKIFSDMKKNYMP